MRYVNSILTTLLVLCVSCTTHLDVVTIPQNEPVIRAVEKMPRGGGYSTHPNAHQALTQRRRAPQEFTGKKPSQGARCCRQERHQSFGVEGQARAAIEMVRPRPDQIELFARVVAIGDIRVDPYTARTVSSGTICLSNATCK